MVLPDVVKLLHISDTGKVGCGDVNSEYVKDFYKYETVRKTTDLLKKYTLYTHGGVTALHWYGIEIRS